MPTNVCNNFNVSWPNEIILHILLPIRIICVRLHNFILPINEILLASFCREKNWKNSSQFLHDETLPRLMIAYFFLLCAQSVISQHFLSCALFLFRSLALSRTGKGHLVFFNAFYCVHFYFHLCKGLLCGIVILLDYSAPFLSLSCSLSSCWFVCLHKNTIINTSWELEKRILYHTYALYAGPMKACRKNK